MVKEVILAYLNGELLERTPREKLEQEATRKDDAAAFALEVSLISNADMVEDPLLANEFALLAWENEVAREVHPPLRKLRECREWIEDPMAWESDSLGVG